MCKVNDFIIKNQELHERIASLEDDNEILFKTNEDLIRQINLQKKMINGLKLNNGRLTLERNELQSEVDRLTNKLNNVTLWDLSKAEQRCAGHQLAKDLLGR